MAPKSPPETHIDRKKLPEMKNETPETTHVVKKPFTPLPKTIIDFAVQCHTCRKWRKLETEEHFEDFRFKHTKERFVCNKLPGTTCEDPTNIINYDLSQVWAMDKPNVPKTPPGFKRIISLRHDCSKIDVQYSTPKGKKLRSSTEMVDYLERHPEFKDISPSNFCFVVPRIRRDTVPRIVVNNSASSTKKMKKKNKNKKSV